MVLFEESGLSKEVEIKVSKVMLQMISIEPVPRRANETALLSEPILRGDWDSPEEVRAWASL